MTLSEDTIKTTLIGAAVGAGLGMLLGYDVTKTAALGGGVGLAKSLFFSGGAGGHFVGALPPGSDYSFTRKPGFMDKNY
ncbi:MAG TPA: hypothetical protein VFA98_02800 [Thermoanaerobaculia bacterium]|jgi:L-aminopeptidase/D-esterase-like protein|nr:hypothetical protein [Thermoanaerobaculia bacterium]